jgi:hypothetical protein
VETTFAYEVTSSNRSSRSIASLRSKRFRLKTGFKRSKVPVVPMRVGSGSGVIFVIREESAGVGLFNSYHGLGHRNGFTNLLRIRGDDFHTRKNRPVPRTRCGHDSFPKSRGRKRNQLALFRVRLRRFPERQRGGRDERREATWKRRLSRLVLFEPRGLP